MENKNIKDEDVLLLAIAAVTLISVYALFRKKSSSPKKRNNEPEKHAYLKIEKELIQEYIDKNGKRIKFKFKKTDGVIKLKIIGSRGFRVRAISQIMNTVDSKYEVLKNIEFGEFENNKDGQTLHEILTKTPLKDWYLQPVENEKDASYVSYDLTDDLSVPMIAHRINPCPPCN